MAKLNVYYLGSREGESKKTNKPYKVVDVLEYSGDRFRETGIFCDAIPEVCKALKSGDRIEIEIEASGLYGKPRLVGIGKISDCKLEKN